MVNIGGVGCRWWCLVAAVASCDNDKKATAEKSMLLEASIQSVMWSRVLSCVFRTRCVVDVVVLIWLWEHGFCSVMDSCRQLPGRRQACTCSTLHPPLKSPTPQKFSLDSVLDFWINTSVIKMQTVTMSRNVSPTWRLCIYCGHLAFVQSRIFSITRSDSQVGSLERSMLSSTHAATRASHSEPATDSQ